MFGSACLAQTAVRGGTAVIVVQSDPGHRNPTSATGGGVHAVADSLYHALVELDRDLKPQPDVAQRWVVNFPTFNRLGEVILQNLAKAGIRIVHKPLDRAAFVQAIFAQRAFDLTIISHCNGADPNSGVRSMYVSNNIGSVPFSNAAAYRNADVDRLFALAAETDNYDERARQYAEIQRIVAAELPYWWLADRDRQPA